MFITSINQRSNYFFTYRLVGLIPNI